MPCNTVQVNTVELEKVKDLDLLEKALREEFGSVDRLGDRFNFVVEKYWRVTLKDGRAVSSLSRDGLERAVGRVKQAYSREAVRFAARRFGWVVEKSTDPNVFYVRKG